MLVGMLILKWGYAHYLVDGSGCSRSDRIGLYRSCAGKFGFFVVVVAIAEIFVLDYIQSKYYGD